MPQLSVLFNEEKKGIVRQPWDRLTYVSVAESLNKKSKLVASPESRISNPKSQIPKLEIGNPEILNPRNPNPRNPKSEFRIPNPESRIPESPKSEI